MLGLAGAPTGVPLRGGEALLVAGTGGVGRTVRLPWPGGHGPQETAARNRLPLAGDLGERPSRALGTSVPCPPGRGYRTFRW